jgi:hypothetical protein
LDKVTLLMPLYRQKKFLPSPARKAVATVQHIVRATRHKREKRYTLASLQWPISLYETAL